VLRSGALLHCIVVYIWIALDNKSVVLVGHGIINKLIQKELILQKWNETKKAKSNNWDYGVFELKT
jgi:hypothetical protein